LDLAQEEKSATQYKKADEDDSARAQSVSEVTLYGAHETALDASQRKGEG
jgi:hypothetical protein